MKVTHAFAVALGLVGAGRRSCRGHPTPAHATDHVVLANETVSEYLAQQHSLGIARPKFTVTAVRQDDGGGGARSLQEGGGEVYSIDVIEAQPSVTSDTRVTLQDAGVSGTVGDYDLDQCLLVAVHHDEGEFALLVVDVATDATAGMARKADGELVQWTQSPGDTAVVTHAEPYYDPNYDFGVWRREGTTAVPLDGGRRLRDEEDFVSPGNDGPRHDEGHGHVHDHDRDHGHDEESVSQPVYHDQNHPHVHYDDQSHHPYDHDHHHDHDILAQLKKDLRGGANAVRIGKRRALYPTDNFPFMYSYQVDMYIEIDQALVDLHTDMAGAVGYINALITAASAIYEREVDTHLHVAVIAVSSLYDGPDVSTPLEGYNKMKATYGGPTWHYTTGHGVDLHHALLNRNLFGGISTLSAICDPEDGFGISTGIEGTISPTPNVGPMYWDIYIFTHEVGHNFAALHTHDAELVPVVDTCDTACPAGSTAVGSATIMSYCHLCGGGAAAIGLTFGGSWNEDDRTNIDNWINNPSIASFNTDAKRIPQMMWQYVSSQTCTNINSNVVVPEFTCTVDADCSDGVSCSTDTCGIGGSCVNTINFNCCGNSICEVGEYASCEDCAFTLGTASGSWTGAGSQDGIMFDVEAIGDIFINGVTFYPDDTNGGAVNFNVDLYTVAGAYSGSQSNSLAWTQLITSQPISTTAGTETTLSFTEFSVSAGSTQAFYLSTSTSAGVRFGDSTASPLAQDDHLRLLNPARPVASLFGGTYGGGPWSWSGSVSYKIPEQANSPTASPSRSPTNNPSKSPSASPTKAPTTDSPTTSPSKKPTNNPTKSPSTSPTGSPTTPIPTTSPTKSPTNNPSKSPSASPTGSPTTPIPTASPSKAPTNNPSKSPSASPTSSPTTPFPTASPSKSPTNNPSKSPSTSPTIAPTTPFPTSSPSKSPTDNPSKSPSVSPTNAPAMNILTMSPSTSPTRSPSDEPSVIMIGGGALSIDVDDSSLSQDEIEALTNALGHAIEDAGCPSNGESKSCTYIEKSLNGGLRGLPSSDSSVGFELVIDAICESSDCSDAQMLANQLWEDVQSDLIGAIADGSLLGSLRAISSVLYNLLEGATISIDFSDVILASLGKWYPDWIGRSGSCKNDGRAPLYMKIFGNYYESSLDACCKRYFSWDLFTCMGGTVAVPNGFYPNWGRTEHKCVSSIESADTLPNYMRNNPEQWLKDDVESCCAYYYNWEYGDCIRLSGGNPSEVATNKWYVNYQEKVCQQDCPVEHGRPCGGLAKPWETLYETAVNCCAQKLSSTAPMTCEAQSTGTELVGTSQWYIDWEKERCVRDCTDSSDASCGGLAASWHELYSELEQCCSLLPYIVECELEYE